VPLWLIGMMGAGKSVAGRAMATRLGVEFVDTDEAVEQAAGRSLPAIWEEMGEERFRVLERNAVERASTLSMAVVATGGGVVLHQPNVALMRESGPVVWLDATTDTLAQRIGLLEGRPLLASSDRLGRLAELAAVRRPLYAAAAHHCLNTESKTIDEVVDELETLWTA